MNCLQRSHRLIPTFALLLCSINVEAGEFIGDLVLLPEHCQKSDSQICKLGAQLTYKDSNGLVWQTDKWQGNEYESGTTDGASIPKWAQPVIGGAYDESYLKAAVIHDHYCYKENQVRSWRQTHRMFYDALVDLGINKVKAKTMYYAVYAFGPHWVNLVPGEHCGDNCIKSISPLGQRWEGDQLTTPKAQTDIQSTIDALENNPDMSLEEIEARARMAKPGDFFLIRGDNYSPTGADDPHMLPHM